MTCALPTLTTKNGWTIPGKCGGELVTQGKGPDETTHCLRCKARWSMDSKEA